MCHARAQDAVEAPMSARHDPSPVPSGAGAAVPRPAPLSDRARARGGAPAIFGRAPRFRRSTVPARG